MTAASPELVTARPADWGFDPSLRMNGLAFRKMLFNRITSEIWLT